MRNHKNNKNIKNREFPKFQTKNCHHLTKSYTYNNNNSRSKNNDHNNTTTTTKPNEAAK